MTRGVGIAVQHRLSGMARWMERKRPQAAPSHLNGEGKTSRARRRPTNAVRASQEGPPEAVGRV